MEIREIAQEFARLCREGRFEDAGRRFWADDVVALEAMDGEPMSRCEGMQQLLGKMAWWNANHEIHRFETRGPYVHGSQFALHFGIDVTPTAGDNAGRRVAMDEVALYTVRDGKIVEERFFY